jgi:ParB-like chromosome segregation protein Spo0J
MRRSSTRAPKQSGSKDSTFVVEGRKIADLKPHPRQFENFDDAADVTVEELAKLLQIRGLDRPVEILSDGTIICGHRRVEAAKQVGWTEIDVVVRHDLEAKGPEAVEKRLIEDNLEDQNSRRQLDPVALARCYKRLFELEKGVVNGGELPPYWHGDFREYLGGKLGISGRTLDRYLRLLKLPRPIQNAVSNGLPMGFATKVLDLPEEIQATIAAAITAGGDPRETIALHLGANSNGKGLHKDVKDAFACFLRNLDRGLADLEGRARKGPWLSEPQCETLKNGKLLIAQMLKENEKRRRQLEKEGLPTVDAMPVRVDKLSGT